MSSAPLLDAADMSVADWAAIRLAVRARAADRIAAPWQQLYAPFCQAAFVIGQLGQSLDGRIATPTGHSHYINGPKAITHLHRLRALVDAVVVGVGTVVADDPMLTVRHVEGQNPARVIIDPTGRLPLSAKSLTGNDSRRCIITQPGVRMDVPKDIEIVPIRVGADGRFAPGDVLTALGGLGFRRILIEGGAATVSAFIAANVLDRLHVLVAPLLIGSGPTGIALPAIDKLDAARRPPTEIYRLSSDLLFDCALKA